MLEVLMPIDGYEGKYAVSADGWVMSLPRPGTGCGPGGVMRPTVTKDGYLRLDLSRNGVRKKFLVHRLVALAYHGLPPTELHEVNHVNGIKTDNRPGNLEWVTRSQNILHAGAIGLRQYPTGDQHPLTRMTAEKTSYALELLRAGCPVASVARHFHVSRVTILNMRKRGGVSTRRNNFESEKK